MSDGISPAEPGTAIPKEAVEAAARAEYEQFNARPWSAMPPGYRAACMATMRTALAAAVPLLGLAARADTDEITYDDLLAAERQAFNEGERRAAAEAERDALRVQLDEAQAALAAVKKLAAEWSSDVEVDEWNPLAELRAALGVQS